MNVSQLGSRLSPPLFLSFHLYLATSAVPSPAVSLFAIGPSDVIILYISLSSFSFSSLNSAAARRRSKLNDYVFCSSTNYDSVRDMLRCCDIATILRRQSFCSTSVKDRCIRRANRANRPRAIHISAALLFSSQSLSSFFPSCLER